MRNKFLKLIILLALSACQYLPLKSPEASPSVNKFEDLTLQRIYTLQDERNTKDLLPYLHHATPNYRAEAALAFASVQDSAAVPELVSLLSDTVTNVRKAASYALGQVGYSKVESDIIKNIQQEKNPEVQAVLLEALGKIATQTGVSFLANYNAPNPTALAGQAWALYRAGLRQQHSPEAIKAAVQLLQPANPYEARLAAAHFLARTPKIDLTPFNKELLTAATTDNTPEVRMAVTQAFNKVKVYERAALLSNIAQKDPDYRVRLSAIRAMSGLDMSQINEAIMAALQDQNINTAIATAEFLQASPGNINIKDLLEVMPNIQDARVRGNLIWVILRNSSPENKYYLNNRYKQQYKNARSAYEKAQLLKGLAGDIDNHSYIADEIFSTEHPIIATTGLEALINLRQQPNFPVKLEKTFADIFKRAVNSGDVALVGMGAAAIREPRFNMQGQFQDYSFLTQAQQKLQLPRDMETNIELQRTIDYLSGKEESITPKNPFTHPINWELVNTIPVGQQVLLKTSKGTIVMQLFVEDAPGTVANFIELVKQDFYDNLFFHRVVPNFVAQGGDKRGDGWGSSDYAIRSEFAPLNYREGYVGMASAGKDTESNQWFITHSPTPHLDGRYTIFAKVVDGMEIVHQLEIGDKILDIDLK